MLKGSIVALVTPFDEEGRVDLSGLRELLQFHLEAGTDGIVLLGTTGEAPTVSDEERMEILETGMKTVGTKAAMIAGIGTNNTEKSIHYAKGATELGYPYLLAVTPYYNKPTQAGLFRHFTGIAKEVSSKVILYNVPGRTGVNMIPETVKKIRENAPNVIALKEAGGNLNQVSETLKHLDETFAVFSGDDSLTLPMLAIGAQGVISVVANVLPREMKEMIQAYENGDVKKAARLHFHLYPMAKVLFMETSPSPTKAALTMMGLPAGEPRSPLAPLSAASREKLMSVMKQYGLIPGERTAETGQTEKPAKVS